MHSAYSTLLLNYGAIPTRAEFDELNGPPMSEVLCILKNRHKIPASIEEIASISSAAVRKAYESVAPCAHSFEVLACAFNGGWSIGLVTSNSEDIALNWLDQRGLLPFFKCVIAKESVHEGKPAPAPYLLAIERTGSKPELSIAIEDSTIGITSAMAAGLKTFAYAPSERRINPPTGCKVLNQWNDLLPWLSDASN